MEACVACERLTFTYPERETPALKEITLRVEPGAFVVLCGPSGCGKTTLLRQLKPALAPYGAQTGEIFFEGTPLPQLSQRDAAAKIGFVLQNPDSQIVTDKVWHELAFGLESLGFDSPAIRLRTAEMASFFGMQSWFYDDVKALSGGQKQLLALASVMALQPSLLILDEPTAQLDPIAASDFLAAVGKINRELGVTVILTEHRLEEAFPLATLVAAMDKGTVIAQGSAAEVGLALRGHGMFAAMPLPMRVWAGVENANAVHAAMPCPVTVREGRTWLSAMQIAGAECKNEDAERTGKPSVELENVWFKYEKDGPDILKGLSFKAYPGALTCVLGGNGTGKTTALSVIAGLRRAYRGQVRAEGTVAMLPQNPQLLFAAQTVRGDLLEMLAEKGLSRQEKQARLMETAALCRLEALLDIHPYDLSGGEQQRAALAKVLLLQPRILLLDEPTKGLDAEYKAVFAGILCSLARAGVTLVMVSHDLEFCAEYADRCALFFGGDVITENPPRAFFSGNSFYTSAANRMARHVLPQAVTAGDILAALGNLRCGAAASLCSARDFALPGGIDDGPPPPDLPEPPEDIAPEDAAKKPAQAAKLTPGRVVAVCAAAVAFLATAVFAALHWAGFTDFLSGGGEAVRAAAAPADTWRYIGILLALALEAMACAAALSWKRGRPAWQPEPPPKKQKLPLRTRLAAAMLLLAVPLTIAGGMLLLGDRKYYFVSLLILLETMLPFAFLFERRKPQARELVIVAVLCALAVAGRAAFFMLPQFKPVTALVIIAGVAFGGETGFLVGAVTGFVSNLLFGQGPWTPWQMFAFGLVGFLAGVLFQKGWLLRGRAALCIYGGLAALVIYGGLLNASSMLTFQPNPSLSMYLAYCLQGLPFDLVHALATVVFLAIAARPMLEKLDRIKIKYGLVR